MSKGITGAQKKRESYLTSLVISETRNRMEAAKHRGLRAFNETSSKERLRVRPNERYLANTLRQVGSTNARAESESRAREGNDDIKRRRTRKEIERVSESKSEGKTRKRRRKRRVRVGYDSASDFSPSSSSSEEARRLRGKETKTMQGSVVNEDDVRLVAFLAKPGRERRGRGAVGPRSVEPGPYRKCIDVEADGPARVATSTQLFLPGIAPARISLDELQQKKLPNPVGIHNRFVTRTMVNTLQSNRYVVSNVMWRARGKQLQLESCIGVDEVGDASKGRRSGVRGPKDCRTKIKES